MPTLRNYRDERILAFDRLAKDWDSATVDPLHPNNHLRHAEKYRRKAEFFRRHHEQDAHWRDHEDYPVIEIGKTYESRNNGVFTIAALLDYTSPFYKDGFVFISTVGTYYTEGGRGTKSYDPHWSDLVREVELAS